MKEEIISFDELLTELNDLDKFDQLKYIKPEDYELFSQNKYTDEYLFIKVSNDKDIKKLQKIVDEFKIDKIKIFIDDMSILSVQQIMELSKSLNIDRIYIPGAEEIDASNDLEQTNSFNRYSYSVEEYINIKTKIDEILKDIEPDLPELNRFLKVYQKLGKTIKYSWDEMTDEPSNRDEAHNLIGPLMENECVCEGYALVLKQVLRCAGIEALYVVGNVDEDKSTSHAWNQVKIDGKWYNCDLTWDTVNIVENREFDYCLQSDEEFINHDTSCEWRIQCIETYDRATINDIVKPEKMSKKEEQKVFLKGLELLIHEDDDKYIHTEFNINNYYLLANLLTNSYRIKNILQSGDPYLTKLDESEKAEFFNQFEEFMNIASEMPDIHSLIHYGSNFDLLPDSDKSKYNEYMNKRLESISNANNDAEFSDIEGENILQAFKKLENTAFYKSMYNKTLEHLESLLMAYDSNKDIAEESLKPILDGLEKKEMQILVLPPQLFDTQLALESNGLQTKSVASYPEYFNKDIPNASTVAMIHEIMHTYIPLDKSSKFENDTQKLVYNVINHSLVELASNCELGMKLSGLDSYFKMPMHNEILKHNFKDNEGIEKDYYISQGVNFPSEFEFESTTEYSSIVNGKTVTKKDELSNDKIRGIVYPYFLLFKNRENENPLQATLDEISRDEQMIKQIYGKDFYEQITDINYIKKIQSTVTNSNTIVNLNDAIARDAFGIEKIKTRPQLPIASKIEESIKNNVCTELGQDVASVSTVLRNNVIELQSESKNIENPEGHGDYDGK